MTEQLCREEFAQRHMPIASCPLCLPMTIIRWYVLLVVPREADHKGMSLRGLLTGGATMADHIGEQLGNYRLLRLLGQGGFAAVYLGEHVYLQSPAALKILRAVLADEDIEGFVTEAQTLARLDHPHILRVLDFAVEDGIPFLVTEYAPN